MKWRKLLYGKGDASRGLWHDTAAYLVSLGFTQEVSVYHCLFVHKERQIDFGLYVGDTEADRSVGRWRPNRTMAARSVCRTVHNQVAGIQWRKEQDICWNQN